MNTLDNQLIDHARKLLDVIFLFKTQKATSSLELMKKCILNEIVLFEKNCVDTGLDEKTILSARYCLCAAIDEAILTSNWGAETGWAEATLLNMIHKDTWGGERFYIILDSCLSGMDSDNNKALLRLIYVILCSGYEGKYYTDKQNVRQTLMNTIKHSYIIPELNRTIELHRLYTQRNIHKPIQPRKISLWVFYLTVCTLTLLIFIMSNIPLNILSKPVLSEIEELHEQVISDELGYLRGKNR